MDTRDAPSKESGSLLITPPFGEPLIAIVTQNVFFFPGTHDRVDVPPHTAKRVQEDQFALMVFNNPETGITSGLAILAQLESVMPIETKDGEYFNLGFNFICRVRVSDPKPKPDLQGKGVITELTWEILEEEELSTASWNRKEIKTKLAVLQIAVKEILAWAPDALEQHSLTILKTKRVTDHELRKTEKLITMLVAALEALKRAPRELLGQILDVNTHALFELYYTLKDTKSTKNVLRLVSNIFHTSTVEERLRRLHKFAEWFVDNFDPILDGEEGAEEEEEETEAPVATRGGKTSPRTLALLKRYQSVKDHMSEEARQEFEQEFEHLQQNPPNAAAIGDRLKWIVYLPWEKRSTPPTDLREVQRILDEDHAGLGKVKDRMLEYVAVKMLNPRAKGKIICLVGPPGVGKTSLGKSIARALKKKFVSLSLGGLDDISDLRGHEFTYHNASPGFIIQLIRRCGERDCVFMLDEVDKMQKNWRGSPEAALLEILDPEQNATFMDHYLGIPFDLSEILFITTANIITTINPTLRDRLEIIEIPGYTPLEKLEIAKHYRIPKLRAENGLPVTIIGMPAIDLSFTDSAIMALINYHTREAGVRNLERELDAPFRKIAKAIISQDPEMTGSIEITEENLHKYCGRPKFSDSELPDILPYGTVPVLAVSDTGGFLYMVEITIGRHPGGRKIAMKGVRDSGENKDDVNKIAESLEKVFDALTADGKILFNELKEMEDAWGYPIILEGNITNGAIPKDGPSAGLSIFLAVYGALRKKSIKPLADVPLTAATGEIEVNLDIVGKIGGLRDKILAASRLKVKCCFVPKANEADLEDIPEEISRDMEIIPVENRWEALMIAYPEDRQAIEDYLSSRSP